MPDPQNDPVRENAVFDAAEPTDAEKALIEQGLNDEPTGAAEGEGAGEPAKGADAVKDNAAADAEAARIAAEAKAQEDAAAAERAEQERQQQESRNAEAARNAEVIARAGQGEKPVAPMDFDAAFETLAQNLDDGEIEPAEYQKKLRDLNKAEAQYTAQVTLWEGDQQRLQSDAAAAKERADNAWNAAALQWEADNAEFMSNALRAKNMQDAIALVVNGAAAKGQVLAPEVILSEAQKIAFDYSGYTRPAPAPEADPKAEIAAALGSRKPAAVPHTLGQAPSAGAEQIRGNEGYAALDALPIGDLEETLARMAPDQLEKYLQDAPGAKANGRGDDPPNVAAA